MAELEQVEKTLRTLRRRIGELEAERRQLGHDLRVAIIATALATAMLAFTATTWLWEDDYEYGYDPYTLWGLAAEHWTGLVALLLILVLAVGVIGTTTSDVSSWVAHVVLVCLSLVAVPFILAAHHPSLDEPESSPGRWLTALAALALAALHGSRVSPLRSSGSG